jgi:hypothetical protein
MAKYRRGDKQVLTRSHAAGRSADLRATYMYRQLHEDRSAERYNGFEELAESVLRFKAR